MYTVCVLYVPCAGSALVQLQADQALVTAQCASCVPTADIVMGPPPRARAALSASSSGPDSRPSSGSRRRAGSMAAATASLRQQTRKQHHYTTRANKQHYYMTNAGKQTSSLHVLPTHTHYIPPAQPLPICFKQLPQLVQVSSQRRHVCRGVPPAGPAVQDHTLPCLQQADRQVVVCRREIGASKCCCWRW
jgi:hypothetical protein